MKIIIKLIAVVIFPLSTAVAQGNHLQVQQMGYANALMVTQKGENNDAIVKQTQAESKNNRAKIYQGPETTKPTQSSVRRYFGINPHSGKLTFNVVGPGELSGVNVNRFEANEIGRINGHSSRISLDRLLDMGSVPSSVIKNNNAKVIQRDGSRNRALAVQIGASNSLLTRQVGHDNIGIHIQRGNNNNTQLLQNGNNNRNALVATGHASGNGGPFTLRVKGDRVANGLAVQVKGAKTFGGFEVTPNGSGGFNMTPVR